jgi:hypothetical protein
LSGAGDLAPDVVGAADLGAPLAIGAAVRVGDQLALGVADVLVYELS